MTGSIAVLRGVYSLFLALGLTLLLSLGVLGIVGGLIPELDLINHFRPWWLLCALLALLLLWPARPAWRLPLAGIAGLSVLLQAPFVLPTAFASLEENGAQGEEITLVTLNLRYASPSAGRAAAFLADSEPDLVFLQEVSADHLQDLQERLGESLPYGVHCVGGRYCNLAILSRFPLTKDAASYLGWRKTPPPEPSLDTTWRKAESALPRDRRAAAGLLAEAALPGGQRLSLFNIHLSWPYPAEIQRRQFRWIAHHLEPLQQAPVILAGDFNSTPWSFALSGFEASIRLNRATQGIFTFPASGALPLPVLPIDQVYVSQDLAIEAVTRGPRVGSDHYPILVRLKLAIDPPPARQ